MIKPVYIEATTLPDAWFQVVDAIVTKGRKWKVDHGSYVGVNRYELDYMTAHIKYPGVRPLIPDVPPSLGIPAPVDEGYVEQYLPYLLTTDKQPNEDYCYSEDTEVLTNNGWKFFKDLSKEDLVATVDPNNLNIEYQKPDHYHVSDYKGIMYAINNRFIDLYVTPKHKLLVSYNDSSFTLEKIEDVISELEKNTKVRFSRVGKYYGEKINSIKIPEIEYNNTRYNNYNKNINYDINDWLFFLGTWLADGSLRRYENKNAYVVVITKRNKEKRNEILQKIRKILPNAIEYDKNILISNKSLYIYLENFGKSETKYIPNEILQLDKDKLNVLYNAMYDCDGDKRGCRYSPISSTLADNVQEILLKISSCGTIKRDTYNNQTKNKDKVIYRIYNSTSTNYQYPIINKSHIKIRNYDGKIYCVHVPKFHTLYVRRNGKSCWSGNTYGERLVPQMEKIIERFSNNGFGSNQECISISKPEDIDLPDPPCLRSIDCRIYKKEVLGKDESLALHFFIYFRSWDGWNGFPANLAGIRMVQEYMVSEISNKCGEAIEAGEMIVSSKGIHIYEHAIDLAKLRTAF